MIMSTADETKPADMGDMSHAKPYEQVFIALFVLTIIEVAIGEAMDTSPIKVAILVFLAVCKAALVAAVFMHVRYSKNPRMIVIMSFIVPLIGAIILGTVILKDRRPELGTV